MAGYQIAWLEEPIPPDDHAAYVRLKEKDIVALASGEHEPGEDGYLDLILTEAVDYVQMDVCCQGGYASGPAALVGDRAAWHGLRIPQLGNRAGGDRRRAPRHLLARVRLRGD